jgi:hypothetical protein
MKFLSRKMSNASVSRSKKSEDDVSVCSTLSSSSHHILNAELSCTNNRDVTKKVTFKRRIEKVKEVPFICDIDEIDEHWYASEDYQGFKSRDKHILEAMRATVTIEQLEQSLGECSRGLEREQPEQRRRSQQHKRECWAIVLSQPEPLSNADAIAKAYSRSTRGSTRDASILARLDAMAAKEYFAEDPVAGRVPPPSEFMDEKVLNKSISDMSNLLSLLEEAEEIACSKDVGTAPKSNFQLGSVGIPTIRSPIVNKAMLGKSVSMPSPLRSQITLQL